MHRPLLVASLALALIPTLCNAEELLLEDYEKGGCFDVNRFHNDFADPDGKTNSSRDAGEFAEVEWAAKWSGLESIGPVRNLSRYKTFQADVCVEPGQPVEKESNFYFQLLNASTEGYSYWEKYVPQSEVPADGKWYRVRFSLNGLSTGHGDGGKKPENFETITGTVCGMTYDKDGSKYKFKIAKFDNITVVSESVDETEVKLIKEQPKR